MLFTYRDLIVWQKSVDLSVVIYELASHFPSDEKYGLSSQMCRAAVSIASNVAEGRMRGTDRSCRSFFLTAFGSAGELDTQIVIARRLPKFRHLDFSQAESLLDEVLRMLNKLIEKLDARISSQQATLRT